MKFGLNDEQVNLSRQEHGTNTMTEQPREGFGKKLLANFGDPMVKILIVALVINLLFTIIGETHWYESAGIALAIALATLVSTFSEYRNENAFQKLQDDASKITTKVYRNNQIEEISIDDIVVGDCVLLQAGDKIPADGVIIDGTINVDQSALNGEAREETKVPVSEDYVDTDASMDFSNAYKVFRGSVVCNGNSVMRVSTVGDNSVYGQIASELQVETDRDTPLKIKLKKLAKQISKFGYIGGIAIAVVLLFENIVVQNGFDWVRISAFCSDWMQLVNVLIEAIMLAVIIIVMAVPEGLPLMIAIVSAQNMGKMLKDNVLVRKISGIETAGSLNLLFSDKTGTITKGLLEVILFVNGSGEEYKTQAEVPGKLGSLLTMSIKQNASALLTGEGENVRAVGGNATERALLMFGAKGEENYSVQDKDSIPFNSTNKYSATTVAGDYNLTLIKGAPEKVIARCKYYYDENGEKREIGESGHAAITEKIDGLAVRAIRVLALATCDNSIEGDELPDGEWTLVGYVGIRDEVRPESVEAIAQVHSAGVQVIMITGDRKETAMAIAKEAGLLEKPTDIVLTSDELAQLTDEELMKKLPDIRVVSRALPSDKSRFVRVAQSLNLVVGMTGDGVNDSPALKRADVGFAMGGGTEVAKEAGDIVILDDNFNSLQKAILYGRTIYNNIRKFIVFQLTINVAAVLISFLAPLLNMESPLSITQILWINLVMDTLAALAFGGEAALKRYMKEKPKTRDEHIVSKYMMTSILTSAFWIVGLSLVFLLTTFSQGMFRADEADKYLLTGFFTFFVFISVVNGFNARTERLNLFDSIHKNKGFLTVMGLIFVIQIIMTYFGGVILRTYGLTGSEWLFVILLALTIVPVDMIKKAIINRKHA